MRELQIFIYNIEIFAILILFWDDFNRLAGFLSEKFLMSYFNLFSSFI